MSGWGGCRLLKGAVPELKACPKLNSVSVSPKHPSGSWTLTFISYFLIRKKGSPASYIQMRHIYAICPLYENWKPSCVQLSPQICSGAFLVFLETDCVVLHGTGFVWLAWPEARNELGPLSGQTPGMAPTFLWSLCPPAVDTDAAVLPTCLAAGPLLSCCPVPLAGHDVCFSGCCDKRRQSSYFWSKTESLG